MTHIDVLIDDNDDELFAGVFSPLLFCLDDLTRHEFNSALAAPQKGEQENKKQKRNETNWRIVSCFKGGGLKGMKKTTQPKIVILFESPPFWISPDKREREKIVQLHVLASRVIKVVVV